MATVVETLERRDINEKLQLAVSTAKRRISATHLVPNAEEDTGIDPDPDAPVVYKLFESTDEDNEHPFYAAILPAEDSIEVILSKSNDLSPNGHEDAFKLSLGPKKASDGSYLLGLFHFSAGEEEADKEYLFDFTKGDPVMNFTKALNYLDIATNPEAYKSTIAGWLDGRIDFFPPQPGPSKAGQPA